MNIHCCSLYVGKCLHNKIIQHCLDSHNLIQTTWFTAVVITAYCIVILTQRSIWWQHCGRVCDLAQVLLFCFVNCYVVRNKRRVLLFFSIPEDLWECLEQASGKPIAAVMNSWTKQMGFPIIVVDQEQVTFIDHSHEHRFIFWCCLEVLFCFVLHFLIWFCWNLVRCFPLKFQI